MAALRPDVVQRRLVLMDELLDDLASLGEVSLERLHSDRLTRRAVERILTHLVDLAVDVNTHVVSAAGATPPDDYGDSFPAAAKAGLIPHDLATALLPSTGFRNILIHAYVDVDLATVHESIGLALADYRRYTRAVARYLKEDSAGNRPEGSRQRDA